MKILLTGVAGFIASNTARLLLSEGHEVVGVDQLNDAYDPALKRWRLDQLQGRAGFSFVKADIADRSQLDGIFAANRFDGVMNLAARAGVRASMSDPWVYLRANAEGSLNVLDACRRHDVRKVFLASTSSLYGSHNPRPFREDASTDRPLSPYAASKKAAEAMTASYAHLYGLDTPIARYFTVYGPAGRPDMSVFRFIRWIANGEPITLYGDGSQERDFTFVEDVARGSFAALTKTRGFEVYNLGGDEPVALRHVIGLIEKNLGRQAIIDRKPFHEADIHATAADITKARTKLGWEPQVDIDEGIRRCCEWYLANKTWLDGLQLGPS